MNRQLRLHVVLALVTVFTGCAPKILSFRVETARDRRGTAPPVGMGVSAKAEIDEGGVTTYTPGMALTSAGGGSDGVGPWPMAFQGGPSDHVRYSLALDGAATENKMTLGTHWIAELRVPYRWLGIVPQTKIARADLAIVEPDCFPFDGPERAARFSLQPLGQSIADATGRDRMVDVAAAALAWTDQDTYPVSFPGAGALRITLPPAAEVTGRWPAPNASWILQLNSPHLVGVPVDGYPGIQFMLKTGIPGLRAEYMLWALVNPPGAPIEGIDTHVIPVGPDGQRHPVEIVGDNQWHEYTLRFVPERPIVDFLRSIRFYIRFYGYPNDYAAQAGREILIDWICPSP